MNKDNLIKIAVLLTVAFFIGQILWPYFIGTNIENNVPEEQSTSVMGQTVFNATVEKYEPYVILKESLDEDTQEIIKNHEDVEDIISRNGQYYVSLKNEQNVPETMEYLNTLNFTPYAEVMISMPPTIDVELQNGSIEKLNTMMATLKPQVAFYIKPNSKVAMKATVMGKQGELLSLGENTFLYDDITLRGEVTTVKLVSSKNTYILPWENRTIDIEELNAEHGEKNIIYERADYVVFNTSLTPSELMEKTSIEYVVYLNENSVTVDENFSDVEQLKNDFGEGLSFPDSTLIIMAEGVNLSYEGRQEFVYDVKVNVESYNMLEETMTANLNKKHEEGETFEGDIFASVLGNTIMEIMEIKS